MSDSERILNFLERAEKRTRRNRRFNEIATSLSIALLIPVTFKLLDLIFVFRGRTVSVFLLLWLAGTAAWIVYRTRGRHTLSGIAANVDRRAKLNDRFKTAYWFIRNPQKSPWIDEQIRQTASQASTLQIDALYPRRVPRASYIATVLLLVLFGLNFIPLSLNHNWVKLQAAPPFSLTDDEQKSLKEARKLLEQAKALENAAIVEKIEDIIQNLEQGNISVNEAVSQLEGLKQELDEGNLDVASLTNGLSEMAAILQQAAPLEQAAAAMAKGDLENAAAGMRQISGQLLNFSPADIRGMQEKFQQASENPRAGLEELAKAFESVAGGLQRGDRPAAQSALDRAARELEGLGQQIDDQALRNEASEELRELAESLQQRGEGGDPVPGSRQTGSPTEESQQSGGESAEGAPPAESEGESGEGAAGEGEGMNASPEAGDQQVGEGESSGKGGTSFGGSTQSAPLEGEATSLEVQFKQELLEMSAAAAGELPGKEEAAGERERSKLDYRNVPSNLTPAQKDLLNQDRIPWESRQLIKNYFQAVKPQEKK